MSNFRKYGGLNYSKKNNIVSNNYLNNNNLIVTQKEGLINSKQTTQSHIDMSNNSLLNLNSIYFMDGRVLSSNNLLLNNNEFISDVSYNTLILSSLSSTSIHKIDNLLLYKGSYIIECNLTMTPTTTTSMTLSLSLSFTDNITNIDTSKELKIYSNDLTPKYFRLVTTMKTNMTNQELYIYAKTSNWDGSINLSDYSIARTYIGG